MFVIFVIFVISPKLKNGLFYCIHPFVLYFLLSTLTSYFLFFFSDVIFCCYMLCFMLYNCIYIYVDRKG